MKKKSNLSSKKKSTDMVLHRTFRGSKATTVSSATDGLAHKLRTLSVPIIDIRKDNLLLRLGLEDQGHGVWRFNRTLKPTRYHRHIEVKESKAEVPVEITCNKNAVGRRESVGDREIISQSDSSLLSIEPKKSSRRIAAKALQVVDDLTKCDGESLSACDPLIIERKMRYGTLKSDSNVGENTHARTRSKNVDLERETKVEPTPEFQSQSSRNQSPNSPTNENYLIRKGKKISPKLLPSDESGSNGRLDTHGIKKSPKVLVNRLASPIKTVVSNPKPIKRTGLNGSGGSERNLTSQQNYGDTHQQSEIKKYGLRSINLPKSENCGKRKLEITGSDSSNCNSKTVKVQCLQNRRGGANKMKSNVASPTNSSNQERNIGYPKRKVSAKKSKRNSESKKSDKNDLDFKVSPSTSAEGKALPKLKLTRKHQKKFQMQWCEVCGVELDSLDHKLEHEFSHVEPRQLFVSLHRCQLKQSSVKLPMYVSTEDFASIPEPKEDFSSSIVGVDDSRPLLSVDGILNENEENAYESYSSTDDENAESEETTFDTKPNPSTSDLNDKAESDTTATPVATPEHSTLTRSPKSVSSRDRSGRKSQGKMRLWKGPTFTRSGRVVKVTQRTKECMEQLPCARVLFPSEEKGSDNSNVTLGVEKASFLEENYGQGESSDEEKLVQPVGEYVEVVDMKEVKDVVKSSDEHLKTIECEPSNKEDSNSFIPSSGEEIESCHFNVEKEYPSDTEGHVSVDVDTVEKNDMPLEGEVSEIISKVEEVGKSSEKDKVSENESEAASCMNQNVASESDPDEILEKQTDSLASEAVEEVPEGEILEELSEGALLSNDLGEEKSINDSIQESKTAEPEISKTVSERDSSDQASTDGNAIEGLFEGAVEDNSKELMMVDESNDAVIGGTLPENVEMQESSEAEFVSVPSDNVKFNMTEDQGLEDISDDEWSDFSNKEMQQSPQDASGHVGDVEMDEEGPGSSVDNVGQDGDMDLGETEKDTLDPMCTGEIASEILEEEMKDLENTEEEMISDNVVDEMAGQPSSKENLSIPERVEPTEEVDMTEAIEDLDDGSMTEAADNIQVEEPGASLEGVGEKLNSDDMRSLEVGEVSALDVPSEGNIVTTLNENENPVLYKRDDNELKNVHVEELWEEVSPEPKVPEKVINLVTVEKSEKQENDIQGENETVENSVSVSAGASVGDDIDSLKECGVEVKNDVCAGSISN